jgi:WD40 repeat protein
MPRFCLFLTVQCFLDRCNNRLGQCGPVHANQGPNQRTDHLYLVKIMADLAKPFIRGSMRTDTLNADSFFNSFIMGQAVKKRTKRSKVKVEISLELEQLNNLVNEASTYILKNAETTVSTPFSIVCLELLAQMDMVLFGSSNGNISQYDLKEGKIVDDIPLNIGQISCIRLHEEKEVAVVVGETPVIRVYRLPRFELSCELAGHTGAVSHCEINGQKGQLFTVSVDSTVKQWDLNTFILVRTLMTHTGAGISLALTSCGKYVFSGGEDCLIRVFNTALEEEVLNLKSHVASVTSLAVNKDNALLASGGADNLLIVWNILDFTPLPKRTVWCPAAATSPCVCGTWTKTAVKSL